MNKLPDIKSQFPEWYNEIIYQSELADQSPVRGCIVIRPYGTALWENIKNIMDKKIKDTGHQNAIFPLLIPKSFIEREAKHVEGFSPELAVVTIAGGKELDEPYVIRPTSETIIHYMFARWLKSWRDLPLKINQWANVVRWEMRTRPFLRTSEFQWQEGHTAHETQEEALAEVDLMLNEYVDLAENYLAIPVISGTKSEQEKFPGADKTCTFEGIMPDGKALQMGTSHLISQSFAKTFEMRFQNRQGELEYPYLTSWGVTTRLVGAVVMTHGDSKGLIIPPKIAPIQVVIVPILKKDADNKAVITTAQQIADRLKGQHVRVHIDLNEHETPGAKFYHWELKGIPLRIEIGPRDIEKNQMIVVDRLESNKKMVPIQHFEQEILIALDALQTNLFNKAKERRDSMIKSIGKLMQFGPLLEKEGIAVITGWCQRPSCEAMLKEYSASIRVLLDQATHNECFNCTNASKCDVIVARSY